MQQDCETLFTPSDSPVSTLPIITKIVEYMMNKSTVIFVALPLSFRLSDTIHAHYHDARDSSDAEDTVEAEDTANATNP